MSGLRSAKPSRARSLQLGGGRHFAKPKEMSVSLPVVRLSRGSFEPAQFIAIRNRLDESRKTLVPAIKALRGCLHFWAGVDAVSNTMINISIWATLEDAKQLDTLSQM